MNILLNVTEICTEFGMRRENVQRLIADAGLTARRGKYRLRELVPVLTGQVDEYRRKAAAQAEEIELRLAARRGDLIERHDVEREHARIFRIVALWADTAPDILERDCGLSAGQIVRLESSLDRMRESLHEELAAAQ